jgi:small subunit ribosomal protein S19
VHYSLLEKIDRLEKSGERKVIRTWSRASVIVPEFLGHNFEVYNGKRWFPVFVTEDLVGHRFGEFSPTRAFRSHVKDERKGKK